MEALANANLCEHFLAEPFVTVESKYKPRIIRVGNGTQEYRPPSVGITDFGQNTIVWAVDVCDGKQVFCGRIRQEGGEWTELLIAQTAYGLTQQILKKTSPGKKSKVSAPQFFGLDFFVSLRKKHGFPKPPETAKCFRCGVTRPKKWRIDRTDLSRVCDRCRSPRDNYAAAKKVDEGTLL
jgi:hypothetical protein